jgi:hypothetical protein
MATRARHLHKLAKLAGQPGGLETFTDDELRGWLADRRAGLARAESDNRGRAGKARRGWADAVAAAEAELERRRV